jgi:hypothetical protein
VLDCCRVTVSVAMNHRKVAEDKVVQLYLPEGVSSVTRAAKELIGLRRVKLAPGQSATLKFMDRAGFFHVGRAHEECRRAWRV